MFLLALAGIVFPGAGFAAEPRGHFFDESASRHLHLEKGEFGTTRVTVRFAGDPGSTGRWFGQGGISGKFLQFSQIVGEDQPAGTYFLAAVSESKVEISLKPGQREPQDMGLLGTYRRVSEAKVAQLAKKEAEAANDRLQSALKAGAKAWMPKDRPALAVWKDQWPSIRDRLMILYLPDGVAVAAQEKTPAWWLALAHATAHGYYFVEAQPDPKTSLEWDGEYDDLAGGHASIRMAQDGRLRLTLSYSRNGETVTGDLSAVALPEKITKTRSGDLQAECEVQITAETPASQPRQVKLLKIGRYLQIETQPAASGKGWFDGIYRGAPVPME